MTFPQFDLDGLDIASIKEALGAVDVVETDGEPTLIEKPKRRIGRPPGAKNKATFPVPEPEVGTDGIRLTLDPAPLTKRDEREVAKRLVNILTGATGMAGMVKPYLPMTDAEAEAIAEPLASYLIRNEATQGVAREILENYDLLAMTLGMGAYSVRVWKDRKDEVAAQRPINTTATQRVSDGEAGSNGRQPNEGVSPEFSLPYASRSGPTPFDV